ncbi:MAG: hypothetical protein RO009_00310 [Pseudorhodoplanes sp.]|jgi:hypothetical protein|nr:hypothetical protein [Pseudorhodoplanes sp.]
MRTKLVSIAAIAAIAGGCAKSADQVGATYVSPILYENYTCPQLAEEAQRVSVRVSEMTGVQNQKATNDAVAMTVGLVIVWPALFLLKGNDETTAELARLKGQMDAIEQASIKKRCGIQFHRAPPPQAPAPAPTTT